MATDVQTLQLRLAEAELARHKLACGASEIEIQQGDKTVKFNNASLPNLLTYIADLKSQLVGLGALAASASGRRKPINILFGA